MAIAVGEILNNLYVRRPLVMRNGTSQSPLRTRLEPAQLIVPSPCGYGTAAAALRSSRARFRRARNARPSNGWTAFRVSLQVACGHPPGPYAYRGLLASVLRTFLGSQRSRYSAHAQSGS